LPVNSAIAIKTLKRSGKGAIRDFVLSLPTLIWKNVIKKNVLLLFNSKKQDLPDATCQIKLIIACRLMRSRAADVDVMCMREFTD